MKKAVLGIGALSLLFLCTVNLFAIDISAGGGVSVNVLSHAETSTEYDESRVLIGGGAHIFADATYLLAIAGISLMEDFTYADLNLLAKYPFTFSSFTVFPLAGGSYFVNFDDTHSNAWGIKVGLGLDYAISEGLYIRPMALVGYRFHSFRDDTLRALFKLYGYDLSITKITVDVSVALGYRL